MGQEEKRALSDHQRWKSAATGQESLKPDEVEVFQHFAKASS